jgi:adenylate cyclase
MTGLKSLSEPRRRAIPRRVWLMWLAGLVLGGALSVLAGERIRHAVFDSWQTLSPRDLRATDVRVVLVDNRSVAAVGAWPWPRYYMARLTEELAARDAKIIAYDILFAEPDRVRPETFVSLYPELSEGAAAEVTALPPMDALFGQVIGMTPVVLAHAGMNETSDNPPTLARIALTGEPPRNLEEFPGELAALPELDDVALGHGLVNARPDEDGVTRTVPLLLRADGKLRPGFAMEVARQAAGAVSISATPRSLTIGERRIAVDDRGLMRLRFGEFPAAHIVSAADVLGRSDSVADDAFAGKVVVVGMSADGTSDIAATPAKAEEYGPLIQAQAVDAMMRGGWLERPLWAGWVEWIGGALLALLALGVAIWGRRYRLGLAAAFLSVPLACWLAFAQGSLLVDPARPLLVGGMALAGAALGLFAVARNDRARLRETLIEERVAAAETQGELEAARAIQLGMVPPRDKLHAIDPRVDLDALLEPAKSVGGDFYDAVMIGENRLALAVADVTGKGVPAALFMAMSKALTGASLAEPDGDPAKMMASINRQLLRDHGEAMSVTMLLAIIDLASGAVRLACAGHEDPLLITAAGAVSRVRLEGGPPLSILPFDYPSETLRLGPGDMLLMITDGVTEAQDGDGTLFGIATLLADERLRKGSAEEVCEVVRSRVRHHEDGTEATDDLTVMALKYLGG